MNLHTLYLAAQVGFYHLICKLEWLFCFFVLVLSGVELVFPTGCVMGLCFGCALETALITQACFSCCWAVLTQLSRPFLLLTPLHQRGGWGDTNSLEGTQPGQLPATDQRDIPSHMASRSAYKAEGK